MAKHPTTRLSIHPAASGDWRRFVDALPGRCRDDKELLVWHYLSICVPKMRSSVAKSGRNVASWQCPFAPEFEFVLRIKTDRIHTEITIVSIRARPV